MIKKFEAYNTKPKEGDYAIAKYDGSQPDLINFMEIIIHTTKYNI